jgi:hypothetical protein
MTKETFLSRTLPVTLLIVWMVVVAVFEWQRVQESQKPPIYDTISYLQKGKSFWENAALGWPRNPMNLDNSLRPPGTVLLTYPFGYDGQYKGFLFRSIYVPLFVWILSLLVIGWPTIYSKKKWSYWPMVLAVFLLGPMTLFFDFFWGMVDTFLASLAALAVATTVRSLLTNSRGWVVLSALVAAFCPLVKPSGALVLLLTTLFWSGSVMYLAFKAPVEQRRPLLKFWLFGSAFFAVLGGTVSIICLTSDYLGGPIVEFMRNSMVILKNEFDIPISFNFLVLTYNSLFGAASLIGIVLGGALLFRRQAPKNTLLPDWIFWTAATLCAGVGLWFWIIETGNSQLRYFYPFALMTVVAISPLLFRKIYAGDWIMSRTQQGVIALICFVPAINIAGLLSQTNPPATWQKITGVNMEVTVKDEGVELARDLLSALINAPKPTKVYCTHSSKTHISFDSYGIFQNLLFPTAPYFVPSSPTDWARPSTYRMNEILESDYLLYKKEQYIDKTGRDNKGLYLYEDGRIIELFLNNLTPEQGLETTFEHGDCRLSKITNRIALTAAFDSLIRSNQWSPVFVAENGLQDEIWEPYSQYDKVFETIPPGYTLSDTILCEGYLDIVNDIPPTPTGTSITTSDFFSAGGWMAYAVQKGIAADAVFLTLQKQDGTILYLATKRNARPDVNKVFHQPNMGDTGFTTKAYLHRYPGSYVLGLAFGYQGMLYRCNQFKVPLTIVEPSSSTK